MFLCYWWHINLRGLSNTKAIIVEEQYWYYLTHSWGDKRVHAFPKGIRPKMNIRASREFELAYFEAVVQHPPPPLKTHSHRHSCMHTSLSFFLLALINSLVFITLPIISPHTVDFFKIFIHILLAVHKSIRDSMITTMHHFRKVLILFF